MINSIDLETGKKYQSNKKQREFVKQKNDDRRPSSNEGRPSGLSPAAAA
ncbi:hypothetical protein AB0M20_14675 [Actinoplanes sp. NPDC051633]